MKGSRCGKNACFRDDVMYKVKENCNMENAFYFNDGLALRLFYENIADEMVDVKE